MNIGALTAPWDVGALLVGTAIMRDAVVERAYEGSQQRAQQLVPFIKNGDQIEEKLKSPRGLMFLKLHGCITRTSDPTIPLILTVDQYVTQQSGRNRLFDHLRTLSYEHPLVFVGHSLEDPDIRQFLLELGSQDERPRYFTVTPRITGPEKRLLVMCDSQGQLRFTGAVDRLEYDYGFLNRDGTGDRIFFHRRNVDDTVWESLVWRGRVSFSIGFNFWGPTAVDLTPDY